MRQQSRVQVRVRGAVIGGPKPLICLPLLAEDRDELLRQATELSALNPDLLEWRVDGYARVAEVAEIVSLLDGLRQIIGNIPLIFTCRIDREGGAQHIAQPLRQALISAALASGNVDLGKDGAGVITEKSHKCYFTGKALVPSGTVKAKA